MTYKDINWYGASLLIGGVVVVILAAYFVWQGMLNEDILEFTGLIVFLFGLFTIGFMLLILILAIADSVVGKLIMWKYLRKLKPLARGID